MTPIMVFSPERKLPHVADSHFTEHISIAMSKNCDFLMLTPVFDRLVPPNIAGAVALDDVVIPSPNLTL